MLLLLLISPLPSFRQYRETLIFTYYPAMD